jgi:hypothetical protein
MAISACEEPGSLIRISGLSVLQRRHVAPATVIDCQSDKVAIAHASQRALLRRTTLGPMWSIHSAGGTLSQRRW